MDWLNSIAINTLNRDLDGLWTRQSVIQDNIANVDTPGYDARVVSFEKELEAQLYGNIQKTRSEKAASIKNSKITTTVDKSQYRLDENGVDVEEEQAEMARTQINYMYALRMLSDDFKRLNSAINGQGG